MGTFPPMTELYRAVMEENWNGLTQFYREHSECLVSPITCTQETALHMAVYSKEEKPIKDLIALSATDDDLLRKDVYGNTVLHAAAVAGNKEAVKLLVEKCSQLLTVTNEFGETPLFRAASFGKLEIVKYLANQTGQRDSDQQQLIGTHRQRADDASILHVAVLGEHFETALNLLELDESLAKLKDLRELTAFHLLADNPSAFKSGYPMDLFKRFLYFLLPVACACDMIKSSHNSVDLESGQTRNQPNRLTYLYDPIWGFLSTIWLRIREFFFEGWPIVKKIWEEKKKHNFALRLANKLVKKDESWILIVKLTHAQKSYDAYISLCDKPEGSQDTSHSGNQRKSVEGGGKKEEEEKQKARQTEHAERGEVCPTPLLLAASGGIIEVVKAILTAYPQAVEQLNNMGQNILHIAVKYRQWKIFWHVKGLAVSGQEMITGIDNRGYNLLHHAADRGCYRGGTKLGPVLQLHEELKWLKSVEELIPSYYAAHIDKTDELTARELFVKNHTEQLDEAKKWIKDTSQSCSTVAVLVATVVFAAAYTAPGGYEKGIPIFLHSPVFMAFTILDVIALASSLTAVVIFLSILTSTFEFEDFSRSLPRKLALGFAVLFFSILTTMLSFASTILLTIRLQKEWTTSLISIAAFLPVTMYALMQFRLYVAFLDTAKDFFEDIGKALPQCVSKKQD